MWSRLFMVTVKMLKKVAPLTLKITVSVVILYFLFRGIDVEKFKVVAGRMSPLIIFVLALMYFMSQLLSSLRWFNILKDDCDVSFRKVFSFYFVGLFFNNFLPTVIGGDVVKGYYLYKETNSGAHSVSSIFLDRYAGYTVLMAFTAGALFFSYDFLSQTELPFFFIALIGSFVCMSLVLWFEVFHGWAVKVLLKVHFYKINDKVESLYNALMEYKARRPVLVKIVLLSVFIQGLIILGYYILGKEIGISLELKYYFLFIPLIAAASMVPISFAGLGVREGVFVYLFTKAGAGMEEALGLSLLWFFITLAVSLWGGVEYLRLGGKEELKSAKEESLKSNEPMEDN